MKNVGERTLKFIRNKAGPKWYLEGGKGILKLLKVD